MKQNNHTRWEGSFPKGPEILLLKAALEKGEQAVRHWEAWCEQYDLETGITLDRYRVLPLAWENLSQQSNGHPVKLLMGVEGAYKKTFFLNNLLLRHLMKVQKMLNDKGIPVIVIKGMGMIVGGIYPKMGARFQFDYDILVPLAQKMETVALFENAGFRGSYEGGKEYHLTTSHSVGFIVPDLPDYGSIDLHWLPVEIFKHPKTSEIYFREKVAVNFRGMQFYSLPPELHLLHTLLHGLKTDYTSCTQWVCDAAMIIRQSSDFDWDKFAHLAKEMKAGYFVKQGMQFLTEEIGIDVPTESLETVKSIPHSFNEPFIFRYHNFTKKGIADLFIWKLFDLQQIYPEKSFLSHVMIIIKAWRANRTDLNLVSFINLAFNRLLHLFKNSSPDYQKKDDMRT